MIPAFVTSLLWSFSVICATRGAKLVGSVPANLSRLALAAVMLAIWAHGFGEGLRGDSLRWFVLSGVVGFGLGDIAGYEALPRIGSRLSVLLMQCLAAPIAAQLERVWLGTTMTGAQVAWATVILAGVALAVAPSQHLRIDRRTLVIGVIFGVLAAIGQAGGAVLSRKAYLVAAQAGQHIDGGTAAYQRVIGGVGFVFAFFLLMRLRNNNTGNGRRDWRSGWPWIVAHTVTGPVVGVGCYQWALGTAPSGIVLPIVATTPLLTIPWAYWLEGERPSPRSLVGGAMAVAGAVALTLVH
jgi:drug/metabolite transporter (DMT)-like permease